MALGSIATTVGIAVLSLVLSPQDSAPSSQPKKRLPAVFRPIEDDPKLPRVLLIGDSISIGYTLLVRELLSDQANLHRPPTNCGPTSKGLKEIDRWLGQGQWDVIHFNWGLHDLKYMGPNGENLADPRAESSAPQVSPKQYEESLEALVQRLKKSRATLIWASTTPVPSGAKGRVVGDAAKYNAIAARVMERHGVVTNDLHTFAKRRLERIQRTADVHFTPEGSKQLAGIVAASILKELKKRRERAPIRGRG